MKKIQLHLSNNYRWMLGNRYISNKTAWFLICILHIAESE